MAISFTNYPAPCKGCPDHCIGCHSGCDRYKQYREDLEVIKAKMKAERDTDSVIIEASIDSGRRGRAAERYRRKGINR